MQKKTSDNNRKKRTKKILISDVEKHDLMEEPLQRVIHSEKNQNYELHIEVAAKPGHVVLRNSASKKITSKKAASKKTKPKIAALKKAKSKKKSPPTPLRKGQLQFKSQPKEQVTKTTPVKTKKTGKAARKVWNFLEWIAVSALIFVVFFFIINFSSYSEIIKSKLDKITGNYKLDPYIEKMVVDSEITQKPLPLIATTKKETGQQIPPLDLEVAPPDERIILPRINKNVPIIQVSSENLVRRDWNGLEADIQASLKDGVVHYPGTAQAGDKGNVVVTGHSSYFPWDPGRFKDVFALLHEIIIGDTIIVYHDQQKYMYRVYDTQVVTPDQVDILTQEGGNRLTLITCTPVGTNLKRLIVFAEPI